MLAEIIPRLAFELQKEPHGYRPRPSQAGPERCIRSMVYHAAGVPPNPFPGRAVLVFDDSSWHEELTKDWLRKSPYRIHSEQMRVETPVGPGDTDWIVTTLLMEDLLTEHKALNHFSFERIWKGEWPLDYLTQLALYLNGAQKVNLEIRRGLLLIKNKNTSAYLELLCSYDAPEDRLTVEEVIRSDGERRQPVAGAPPLLVMERVTAAAVEKFAAVERHRAAGTLPPRPFEYGTQWPCSYCGWAQTCWGSFEEEFERMPMADKLTDEVVGICVDIVGKRDAAKDMTDEAKALRGKVGTMLKAQEQDIVDACGYFFQADSDAKELAEELEEFKSRLKALLHKDGVRGGAAGEYRVTLSLRKREAYSVEATQWEQVDVRKIKPKEPKKGNGG